MVVENVLLVLLKQVVFLGTLLESGMMSFVLILGVKGFPRDS